MLTERVTAVRGTVDNPMLRGEVVEKAPDLCAPVIGQQQAATLVEAVLGLETMRSVRDFRALLRKA